MPSSFLVMRRRWPSRKCKIVPTKGKEPLAGRYLEDKLIAPCHPLARNDLDHVPGASMREGFHLLTRGILIRIATHPVSDVMQLVHTTPSDDGSTDRKSVVQ